MSNESENEDEDGLLAYPIEWEDVRKDMKYPTSDDNAGFIYGIQWMDGDEVSDITWYKTEEERWSALAQQCLKCGSNGHITEDHDWPEKYTEEQLTKFGWEP
jgi:hypothetical protein